MNNSSWKGTHGVRGSLEWHKFISLPTFPSGSNRLQLWFNLGFGYCRWEYVCLNSEDDSLWESFPQILQSLDRAKRYVDAFRAPLQGLTMMKDQQVHTLRACSLVAIPPSEERMPPPGGFPRDLSGMNLTSCTGLIQDVAQGMKVVPPNLTMEVCLDSMVLLQLLEATTGMGYCRICCQPSSLCRCPGDYQQAPTETWSQMMARILGQGVAASVGGPTTPGTATAEVQEQGVPPPPPGLHPPDFTNWSLPFPEAPVTGGLLMPSGGLPSITRQTVGPQASGQPALAPPMQAPSAPQGVLQVHQPRPSQPATPYEQAAQPQSQPATLYQQAVQPPRKLAGRGLLARPPSDRAAPAPNQTIPNCRRQQTRGWGIRGRSVSCPGWGWGMATNAPSTIARGDMQSQPGHHFWPRCPDGSKIPQQWMEKGPWACAQGLLQRHSANPFQGVRVGSSEGMLLWPPHPKEGWGARY